MTITQPTRADLLPVGPEECEQVAMRDKVCDETQRLLNGDAAQHVDNVRIVALGNFLHHVNLT